MVLHDNIVSVTKPALEIAHGGQRDDSAMESTYDVALEGTRVQFSVPTAVGSQPSVSPVPDILLLSPAASLSPGLL